MTHEHYHDHDHDHDCSCGCGREHTHEHHHHEHGCSCGCGHDHDHEHPYGRVPGMDVTAFPADRLLSDVAFAAAEQGNPGHARRGRIASGDRFVAEKSVKEGIIAATGGLCTEMEGAAIAQTAYRNGVPFVILRAISDKADDSAQMDYPTFERLAAHRCAEVTRRLAEKLKE